MCVGGGGGGGGQVRHRSPRNSGCERESLYLFFHFSGNV